MNKRERMWAAARGERVDRIPVALWRHFPNDDQDAASLAKAVTNWQTTFDWDMVKVTPASGYTVEDWGARFVPRGNREGTRECIRRPVQHPRDWESLWPLNVNEGVLGRELEALRLVRAAVGPDVVVAQTVFSPLTVARSLAGEECWLSHLRDHPLEVRHGMSIIADSYARFAEACLHHGADGIFFATQCATTDLLTEDEYAEFGIPYDRHVMGAFVGPKVLSILHIHGFNIMFDLLASTYPVDIINWHDRRTAPTLSEARGVTRRGLMGGINEWQTLIWGSPAEVQAEVQDAIAHTGGRGYIVGAGCVVPIDIPERNLRAARSSVE